MSILKAHSDGLFILLISGQHSAGFAGRNRPKDSNRFLMWWHCLVPCNWSTML